MGKGHITVSYEWKVKITTCALMLQNSFQWPLAMTHTLAHLYEEDQLLRMNLMESLSCCSISPSHNPFHQFSNESCLTLLVLFNLFHENSLNI